MCRSIFDQRLNPVAPGRGVQRTERHLGSKAVADHLALSPGEHRL
jgi:hypothetical protein